MFKRKIVCDNKSMKSFLSIQTISKVAMLSALCVALRFIFSSFPNIQPITALFLVLVGAESLFFSVLVMSLSLLISSFLLGFGPWIMFQIISFALVLLLWRLLIIKTWHPHILMFLATCLAFLYGIIIDSLMAVFWEIPWCSYVVAGLPFNLYHALSTLLFYPILEKILRRFYNEKNVKTSYTG